MSTPATVLNGQRPDWELLATWVAVIEMGGVSEAARLLHVSHATVSRRVKQLETIFATALLDRSTRPALSTAAGQRLFESAKDLVTRADNMVETVRNVGRAERMIARIGGGASGCQA
jgi:DNA-binding transcriptional LysR family regulator